MLKLERKDLEASLEFRLAANAIDIGKAIRVKINNMPLPERATPSTSILKPDAKDRAKFADSEGERIGIESLEQLSNKIKYNFHLIVDPSKQAVYKIGKQTGKEVIFAYMDAVDGTIKVAGLGNEPGKKIYRLANDGAWGSGFAFTSPTTKTLDKLTIGDFSVSAIVDGNPPMYKTFPREVITLPYQGKLVTFEVQSNSYEQVFTSTNGTLSQSTVYLDNFQAFDKSTRKHSDEREAVKLYSRLIDRNEMGAFDVLRQYGNLSALLRNMLGWKSEEFSQEPQCVAFIAINENLPNMLPAVPTIIGASGLAIDFDGNDLKDRKLVSGRCDIIYAANQNIASKIIKVIHMPL